MVRVTLWNERVQDREEATVLAVYPEGINAALAAALSVDAELVVRCVCLQDADQGLADAVLDETDVLVWWGHRAHQQVRDDRVDAIERRVRDDGMGLLALHSAHFSKPFIRLMGRSCRLRWRNDGKRERVWNVQPDHPMTQGIGEWFDVPREEMYGEAFDVPQPDEVVLMSWFEGGEVFRSGCVWRRGAGRVVYFRPGHETYPVYHQAEVQRVIRNAVRWLGESGGGVAG
jgi:trehalose utilization protein